MAKKKDKTKEKEAPKKIEVVEKAAPAPAGEDDVSCPVCGKPVGSDVPSCPHCGAEFEEEDEAPQEAVAPDSDEVSCPVCGKPVGADVPSCPHCGAEFEEEVEVQVEEEQVSCPVCNKPVGLDVTSCPHCGAEFEEEEEEAPGEVVEKAQEDGGLLQPIAPEPPAPAPAPTAEPVRIEGETADCPVCGKPVSLDVTTCPFCGAEFEEEEVEEVIEVEEQPAAKAAHEEVSEDEVEVAETGELAAISLTPKAFLDLRVIGVSLIILGIIGSQISTMIDWYWSWVPPIQDNIGLFVAIPAAVIIVGLLVFMLVKKAVSGGKKVPRMMPNLTLSLLLFGVFALVLIMLWDPINSALQSSKIGVAGAFLGLLVVGILAMFMGQRMTSRSTA